MKSIFIALAMFVSAIALIDILFVHSAFAFTFLVAAIAMIACCIVIAIIEYYNPEIWDDWKRMLEWLFSRR